MPRDDEECAAILMRLDAIEGLQRQHAASVGLEIATIKSQLDRIEEKAAIADAFQHGQQEAYAKLGKTVTILFATIGAGWAFFHWLVSEGGRDWLKSFL